MLPEYSFPLHTLPVVGLAPSLLPTAEQVPSIISQWLNGFTGAVEGNDIGQLMELFATDGNAYWRDILALTWDYRTFSGVSKIKPFLEDRVNRIHGIELAHPEFSALLRPAEDMAWLHIFIKFNVGEFGSGSGLIRLVPFPSSSGNASGIDWKIQTVLTTLVQLVSFPERTGPSREEVSVYPRPLTPYTDRDPTVLIVGGGQCGLNVAARLKLLGVESLIIEKENKIGDVWRERYDALRLQDPVWCDHLAYLPFPPNWPVYASAKKFGSWLQYYAEQMELDCWLSSTVSSTHYDDHTQRWSVTVHTQGKEKPRVFIVKHVLFAIGFGSGQFKIPSYPGLNEFGGTVKHSCEVKGVAEYANQKVVIVGSGTSAHDIAEDCVAHGIDTTMIQRGSTHVMSTKNGWKVLTAGLYCEGGPPTDIADEIVCSFPNAMGVPMGRGSVDKIAELDKATLDGLVARGFKLNKGYMDSGVLLTTWVRRGGYYLDTGASQLIIDGKIKLKSDSNIESFDEKGLRFIDGSRLDADVVIFATGLGSVRDAIVELCGPESEQQIGPIWGLDEEGEFNSVFRNVGIPGLWVMMGNLALVRPNSKFVALQIKAIEEGLFDGRY